MPFEYYSPTCGGAISTIIMQVSRELQSLGHRVTVLTKTNQEPVYDVGTVFSINAPQKEDLSLLDRVKCKMLSRLDKWDWPYFGPYKESITERLKNLDEPPDSVIVFNDFVSPKYIKAALPETSVYVWLQNEHTTAQAEPSQYVTKVFTCSEYIRKWAIEHLQIPKMLKEWKMVARKRAEAASWEKCARLVEETVTKAADCA